MREKASDKPSYIHIYIAQTAPRKCVYFPILIVSKKGYSYTIKYFSKGKHLWRKPLHSEYEKFGVAATSVLSCRLVTAFFVLLRSRSSKDKEKTK